jgi:predicted dithiol-disulfide oxidoreductase (DUF899 family)
MLTPPLVSVQEWEAAHREMLVKEKEFTRARGPVNPIPKIRMINGHQ